MTYRIAAQELKQALGHLRRARAAVYMQQYDHYEDVDELVRDCAEVYAEIYGEMEEEHPLSERAGLREVDEDDLEQLLNLGRRHRAWDR